mgnify:FL=1
MENVSFILSGCVIGIIIFQSAVIAPVVFSVLSGQDASVFLRKIFPLFFLLIACLSIINTICVFYNDQLDLISVPLASFVLAILAYLLIPATNSSRDEGNEVRFRWLHRASVLITLLILVCNGAIAAF